MQERNYNKQTTIKRKDEELITNNAYVTGVIQNNLVFSFQHCGIKYYETVIKVKRFSEWEDVFPIIIPGNIIEPDMLVSDISNKWIEIKGQFRSHNIKDDNKNKHVKLFVLVKRFELFDTETELFRLPNTNAVYLNGYICVEPRYKEKQSRVITEFILAVNRKQGDTDYLPCVAWGKNAIASKNYKVGDHIELVGRIESREFIKTNHNDSKIVMHGVAYEVSIRNMKYIN